MAPFASATWLPLSPALTLLAEISDDPIKAIFAPIVLPMGVVYDGVYHATGITAHEIGQGLNVANSAVGTTSGIVSATQGSTPRVGSSNSSGSGNIPAPSGYSQRGAFEDCARVYQAAGRPDLAQQCATNATNMSSAR